MKKKLILVAVLSVILLTGCVVKSLKPFYTKETLCYDDFLVGKWLDEDNYTWKVRPLKGILDKKDNKLKKKAATQRKHVKTQLQNPKTGELEEAYLVLDEHGAFSFKYDVSPYKNIYNQGYWVEMPSKNGKMMQFIAIPFQIKGQLFLDFTPFDVGLENLSNFAAIHYVGVHTLAKVDKEGEQLRISWFSEEKIKSLFEQGKIRINHEKIGVDKESYLLTASSRELQKFIAKYMESKDVKKWETDVAFVLERAEQYD